MPLWTETELEIIAPGFATVDNWLERFKILGGIPRNVLEIKDIEPTNLLLEACRKNTLDDCISLVGKYSTITEESKTVHSLVHITSSNSQNLNIKPYTEPSVIFASNKALEIIVQKMGNDAKLMMQELLESWGGHPLTASLCGYIFEPYVLELLEKGGTFNSRQLVSGRKKPKPDETTITIPKSEKIVVEKVLPDQTRNKLHIPMTKNYAAIDAWIPGIGAFQITVGKKHDIKGGAKNDLAQLGKGANKLYWLLPPPYYQTFTKKTPLDIDQYAVLIPYPVARFGQ
jgi:hypothetical protein